MKRFLAVAVLVASASTASAQEAALKMITQPVAGPSDCSDGVKHDDGTFEVSYGTVSVFGASYVMQVQPPAGTQKLENVCVCWLRDGTDSSVSYDILIWDSDGPNGAPGTLLGRVGPVQATGVSSSSPKFYRTEISQLGIVTDRPVYVGPYWDSGDDEDFFVCADQNGPGGQPAYAEFSFGAGDDVAPTSRIGQTGLFPQYRALGVRAAFSEAEPPPPPPDPDPPAVPALLSAEYPDFRFWVRISDSRIGTSVTDCLPETVCVAGAIPTRAEVFLRIVGPKSNGYLWPNVVKFNTTKTEVWIQQISTGTTQYYLLPALPTDSETLPGVVDKTGFLP